MITKVVSGGQSGADQAGWRAARHFGISTTGWMPKGFLTEDGPRPEFAGLYGAREHESSEYPPRTRANVLEADVVLWFGDPFTPGGRCTRRAIRQQFRRPLVIVNPSDPDDDLSPAEIAAWLEDPSLGKTLMVAGNRESKAPGIGAWVESYLCEVFRLLGHEEGG
jgi:hypothetical protein